MPERDRSPGPRLARAVLFAAYLAVVLYLLAPVLLTSIGADDRVSIMKSPADHAGSVWASYAYHIRIALQFSVQDRATALAFAERTAMSTGVMNLAVALGTPPMIFWALIKLALLGLTVVAARVFAATVRYRGSDGEVHGLGTRTIGYLTLAMPLLIALGVKAQDRGGFNGWNYYPTLTYGLFPSVLVIVVVAMRLHRRLSEDYRRWLVPVGLLFVAWGVVVAFSFELLVVDVPVLGLVMLLQPRATSGSVVRRWRASFTIAGAFGLTWFATYVAIKLRIGARDCAATDSCYQGTVIDVRPGTVVRNFLANLPLGTGRTYAEQARRVAGPHPSPGVGSLVVGVLAVGLLGALLVLRHRYAGPSGEPASRPDEVRGLATIGAVVLVLAVASAVITGVTELAVGTVIDLRTSYHVGPVVWTSLALAGAVLLRALWLSPWRWTGPVASVLAALVAVAVVTVLLPRNQLSAQVNRREAVFSDFLQEQVALGSTDRVADTTRCRQLRAGLAAMDQPLPAVTERQVSAAFRAFRFYHQHHKFCTTTTIGQALGRVP